MADNIIKEIPEFTENESETGEEEVKEAPAEEVGEEKETPAEPPAAEEPAGEEASEDTGEKAELERAVGGLRAERESLLKEVVELKGQRRELKQQEIAVVEKKIDDLKDLHPEDVALINRVLEAQGYVKKDEIRKEGYEQSKRKVVDRFLEDFPEYKVENDPGDLKWGRVQKHLATYFKAPDDPELIYNQLVMAHRETSQRGVSDRGVTAKKHQAETAGVGAGGALRSSSKNSPLDAQKRSMLEVGGWSEEEIREIEEDLQNR